ncbi:CDP-diacylglycerol--glycerol-3-phosphate 3-phosphatidyltransferase [Bifidobacterium hapali]|uniref:CDP-diacylglycerol--glycerol-3-phosphate 3-phosphatidyltransferase n=1 Tax=Bifidobacterium hapali TaxID=1630172 RepID=A0A261FYA9_9BIFI|nr:CDP-alcohol phosphatidyltransferase family protein [Bifidobacterium hapali]OZG64161.1 CDP-diacylglycerol--glycerol-3-phosphate 3-phosphatidyltransferase [Bifidobacterium hapali]
MDFKRKFSKKYSPEARDIFLTVPNMISLLRIISIPIIAGLVSHHHMIEALIVLAISAISDGVDGILARLLNQVSKVGQILDPIADRLLILCSVLALGIAGIIPWWMIIIVGLRDLMMGIEVLWLAQHDYGPLPVNFVGKAGTAMLMISITALIFCDIWVNPLVDLLHLAALAAGIWGIGLYWLAGYIYLRQGISLIRSDGSYGMRTTDGEAA